MTEVYDPLKDPASDGYAKVDQTLKAQAEAAGIPTQTVAVDSISRQAWINGQTDIALFDNSTFKKWGKRILWVAVFAFGFWIASDIATKYQAYSAKKEAIEAPQDDEPEQPTPPKKKVRKTATEKIADKAINTPATVEYMPEVKAAKPVETAKVKQPSQEHKSDEAPIDLPLRPIPPIPPQRSIP